MSTPHCFVCQRWDGTHSGGCPQTGQPYVGTFVLPTPKPQPKRPTEWVERSLTGTLSVKDYSRFGPSF